MSAMLTPAMTKLQGHLNYPTEIKPLFYAMDLPNNCFQEFTWTTKSNLGLNTWTEYY